MAAKKTTTSKPTAKKPVAEVTKTAVRNTPLPKVSKKAEIVISQDQIAKRAYEIFASGKGGSESDNWHQAERQLRAGL